MKQIFDLFLSELSDYPPSFILKCIHDSSFHIEKQKRASESHQLALTSSVQSIIHYKLTKQKRSGGVLLFCYVA